MSSLPKLLKIKDYVTLIGTVCGLTALIYACVGDRSSLSLGFFLVSIAVGTDLADGYIARKTGTVNEIGKELDSLNDSMAFGITPAMLTFQAFKTGTLYDVVLGIGCILFSLGAILRLARFNISTDDPGYSGVPTPISGLLALVFFYFNYFFASAYGGPGEPGLIYPFPAISNYVAPFLMGIIAWFNITTFIKFKEKDKTVYVIFLVFAPLAPTVGIIGISLNSAPVEVNFIVSMIISIGFLVAYILVMVLLIRGFFIKIDEGKGEKLDKIPEEE